LRVTITGPANAAAVSEYTFALLLALGRHVPTAAAQMKEGRWLPQDHVGVELEGKAMGVVGLGQIGGRVCRHARGFGMRVLGCDPFVGRERARELEVEPVAYDDLLGAADVVSFHVPLTPQTRHLLDRRTLAKLKRGVRIINTCRGEVIDEAALLEGLRSGVIAGAALDTFEREPLPPDSPLLREPRVLLSPHIAGQTEEALHRMATTAARAILDELEGRRPPFVRNPAAYEAREGHTAGG
jgi:D-3-phosphoglycerate dehydrogenase / 2-oxoglutarate reductase